MKRFLIATTMLVSASTASAFADDLHDTAMDADQEAAEAVNETTDNTDLDRDAFSDDHAWIDTGVYGADGTELGDVERVRLTDSGEVDAVIVETGGTLEVGGREVLVKEGRYRLTTVEGENRIELMVTSAEFEAMPDFDESLASNYPLSHDGSAGTEGDQDTSDMSADAAGEDDVAMSRNPAAAEDDTTTTNEEVAVSSLTTAGDDDVAMNHDTDAVMADDHDMDYAATDAPLHSDADRSGYTDTHAWIDTPVHGSDGSELGNVERVRLSSDGEVEAIVVEYGGTLDIGGREVLIERADFNVETLVEADTAAEGSMAGMDTETRIVLMVDSTGLDALPAFDEDAVSDYPLSDDDVVDDIVEDEDEMDDESGS